MLVGAGFKPALSLLNFCRTPSPMTGEGLPRTRYGGEADFCYEPPATTETPSTLTSTSWIAAGSSSSKSSGTGKYPP